MRCETYPNFKDKVKIFDGCKWAQKDVINKCNIGFNETQFFFTPIKKICNSCNPCKQRVLREKACQCVHLIKYLAANSYYSYQYNYHCCMLHLLSISNLVGAFSLSYIPHWILMTISNGDIIILLDKCKWQCTQGISTVINERIKIHSYLHSSDHFSILLSGFIVPAMILKSLSQD